MAEVYRTFTYDSNEDGMMVIRKKRSVIINPHRRTQLRPAVYIRQRDAHLWSEDHYDTPDEWGAYLKKAGIIICGALDLGDPSIVRLSQIAHVIQSGIDELVKMPPPAIRQTIQVGEIDIDLSVNGSQLKFTAPMREDVFHI